VLALLKLGVVGRSLRGVRERRIGARERVEDPAEPFFDVSVEADELSVAIGMERLRELAIRGLDAIVLGPPFDFEHRVVIRSVGDRANLLLDQETDPRGFRRVDQWFLLSRRSGHLTIVHGLAGCFPRHELIERDAVA
jgi:hypothetical protein